MLFMVSSMIWTGGYFFLVYTLAHRVWHLNIFEASQLNHFLLTLPLWLIGEIVMFSLFKKKKSSDIVKQAVQDHPFVPVKGFVPRPMPTQGRSSIYTPTPTAPVSAPVSAAAPVQSPLPTPQPNPTKVLEQEAVAEITKLAEAKGTTAFPHVLLKNVMLPLTVSSDVQALLFKFLSFPGSWQVEMKENVADSLWKNGEKILTPFKDLIVAKEILAEMEPSAEVQPVLVLLNGTLEQASEVQMYLEKNQAHVVTLKPMEGSPLKTVEQLLDTVFVNPIPPMPDLKETSNEEGVNAENQT